MNQTTTNLAGNTKLPVGTMVRITRIHQVDADDIEDAEGLEGQTGQITHPFRGLMWPGEVYVAGVRLEGDRRVNLTERDAFEVVGAQS